MGKCTARWARLLRFFVGRHFDSFPGKFNLKDIVSPVVCTPSITPTPLQTLGRQRVLTCMRRCAMAVSARR
eukprot:8779305-Pyramimonas_sp.AAC.1